MGSAREGGPGRAAGGRGEAGAPAGPAGPARPAGPGGAGGGGREIRQDLDGGVLGLGHLGGVLGPPRANPCQYARRYVSDEDRVAVQSLVHGSDESIGATCQGAAIYDASDDTCIPVPPFAYRSGPREEVFFDPKEVQAAVVTCGGLCPGLNDVVRGIVETLESYGVPKGNVIGVRYGLRGFYQVEHPPVILTSQVCRGIQHQGGTILGTSRGGADVVRIVDAVQNRGINMVFVIGGNGGNAAAAAIQDECEARSYGCAVVGVPKSIDNDILLIDRTFGYDTAVEVAVEAIKAATTEATSALRGVGLVKLMGRQSGFIAANASLSAGDVDACLIPEETFEVHGEHGLLQFIEKKVSEQGHCVIVVAEGALQGSLASEDAGAATDASGNAILEDVGRYLRKEIKSYFRQGGRQQVDLKYIDPSYMIRSVETNASDKILCIGLAQGAVHGAFAGFTGFTVGMINNHCCYLPISLVVCAPKVVDVHGKQWQRVLSTTRQPRLESNPDSSR